MDKIVALCKNRGYIFSGSEIYGGLANCWDYGPLGVLFLNNIKGAWWRKFVQESPYNVGVDCAILMNPEVWVASGHVVNFNDPLMDCRACKARFRADKLIEDYAEANGLADVHPDGWTNEQMEAYINEKGIVCPECGKHDFTGIRKFNMMFKTFQGVNENTANEIYLRPETAQGIFVNFQNVQRTMRKKSRSELHRSANLSATKSLRATSFSAQGNLSRWSLNSSANPARNLNGTTTGAAIATTSSAASA